MNNIKSISLIFENCEVYTIPALNSFTGEFQCRIEITSYRHDTKNGIGNRTVESVYFKEINITIPKDVEYEIQFSFQNSKSLFDRILSCQDITKILFEFEFGEKMEYSPPWNKNINEYNLYQESCLDADGNLIITIGDYNDE